ncbi:hypothetical protein V5O48_001524 [Marasmius crinis-equi]|uniref:J domain-containing protein n=1 Tax=Marasmius crinis-equi TaxID=585013 RepID=A0ABR3FY25_9AGAR
MASDLYETLGIAKDATPEQIRKAYKKRALETHPDRHPNATPEEKEEMGDRFRRVGNAYEVLNDPRNRRVSIVRGASEYDRHGVWPPPSPDDESAPRAHRRPRTSHRHHHHHDHFFANDPFSNDSFFNDPFFSRSSNHFRFSDPFDLFERMFQGAPMFGDPINPRPRHHHHNHPDRRPAWNEDPFSQARRMHNEMSGFMSGMHRSMLAGFPAGADISSSSGNGNGRFTSQVYMSSSMNGVTHSIKRTRDWNGNEIVTKTYPDGRKVVTINGVEQREQGYLDSSSRHSLPEPRRGPPVSSQEYSNGQYLPPPPPYSGPQSNHGDFREHRHRSRNHDTRPPVIPPATMYDSYQHHSSSIPDHHGSKGSKKHWGPF